MSWFCQGITEDGRLCWLEKGHEPDQCQAAPITGSTTFIQHPLKEQIANPPVVSFAHPVFVDGSVQLPLPGM